MSQTGQQIVTIQKLSDISRSKGNLAMKSGQLIKYDIRSSFLKKLYTKCCGETSHRHFTCWDIW